VIRPHRDVVRGMTTWILTREPGRTNFGGQDAPTKPAPRPGSDDLKVHPGRDWFTVLSGTALLVLGERTITVKTGQAAEFSCMIPHAFGAVDGPAEILGILDHDGQRTHLQPSPHDSAPLRAQ